MANKNTHEPLLSAKEIAAILGISIRTVGRWTAAGIITGHRCGPRLIRYRLAEVERALETGGAE